ncbi:HalOD1 output domain-containing protein [Natrarchaeobaculum aegyptiacum]|uniref:Halobacterial output domain-containing protein n=1 Tax=Natrarchaeobaculum aegyptiacum TaxID=745377 RepID=A0A2Z2HPQ8_9EURY|nr:HalOD1 output domain-containing protein [Natrarchaeobaculum aegyptiacum]ARS88553.1 hypothetical protein B1756_01460 [Natrarchaeobaculum aegyptiacum]
MEDPRPHIARYDPGDGVPLSITLADAIATYRETDVTDLEPLHGAIDTGALDRLFAHVPAETATTGVVRFEYDSCLVTISSDGEIRIESV